MCPAVAEIFCGPVYPLTSLALEGVAVQPPFAWGEGRGR